MEKVQQGFIEKIPKIHFYCKFGGRLPEIAELQPSTVVVKTAVEVQISGDIFETSMVKKPNLKKSEIQKPKPHVTSCYYNPCVSPNNFVRG